MRFRHPLVRSAVYSAAASPPEQRAVELTAEPARRSGRALAAAQASLQAGAFEAAAELLAIAAAGPLDQLQQARVDLACGQMAFASSLGGDVPALLMKAPARNVRPPGEPSSCLCCGIGI